MNWLFMISMVCMIQGLLAQEGLTERQVPRTFSRRDILASDSLPKKSVTRALGLSLLVPGGGQLYSEYGHSISWKGLGFLGAEVACWVLYFDYRSRGKAKERSFKRYAEQYWNIDDYLRYLETELNLPTGHLGSRVSQAPSYRNPGIDADRLYDAEEDWAAEKDVAVHHLFGSGEQQYYEMIYKYPEQFALGWADAIQPGPAPGSPTGYDYNHLSQQMIAYRSMRNRSNDLLGLARSMTGIMLVNRVLSGLDAVWTVKRRNRADKVGIGFRLRSEWFADRYVTLPSVSFTF